MHQECQNIVAALKGRHVVGESARINGNPFAGKHLYDGIL
jgi:hypothetical protein